jgi:3,5-epimerase/4-reductase
MKYLIYGNGYIANLLRERLGHHVILAQSNLLQQQDIIEELARVWPDVVINAAGRTGRPNIDWCEDHQLETLASNTVGAFNLATACHKAHFYFCHIGSGCVYEGGPYKEEDEPNFTGSFYSKTKIWAEKLLANMRQPCLQLRIRMPFDWRSHPRNFIDKLLSYKQLIDVSNSISIVDDMIAAVRYLTEKKHVGIFNIVNKGGISHREIINYYKEMVDSKHICEFVPSIPTKAGRSNCILDVAKLEATGFVVRNVHDAVRDTLRKRI